MIVEIISIGTELLMGMITDTNAAAIAARLPELGSRALYRQTVGDNLVRLTEVLERALDRSDVVIAMGGLGPTEDDITRDGIAGAIGDELILDERLKEELIALFSKRSFNLTNSQYRQAMRPSTAEPIDNPNGTAPGIHVEWHGKHLFALPGPPNECLPMFEAAVAPFLAASNNVQLMSRVIRVMALGEAAAEERLSHLLSCPNPTLAPYAKLGEVHFRITAAGETESECMQLLDNCEQQCREALGDNLYGLDDTTLERAVMELLWAKGQTVATAESCTGGLIAHRFSGVPGASRALMGAVVAYDNRIKRDILGVSEQTLTTHGAVSEQTACEMAEGVRQRLGVDWAISTTGIAGPDGGTAEKPVGMVWLAVAGPDGVVAEKRLFGAQRDVIQWRASQSALDMLRRRILAAK
ncbi:MAG: competence/damage-inducible protein A [Armatimonadota bacterium]